MSSEQPKNASPYTKSAMKKQAAGLAPRAYSIPQFCTVYGISRSKCYVEIGAKRLPIRKIGRTVLIAVEDAEAWFASFAEAA
jgi:hypothetical protein